tara:strand:+ start:711 stop:1142 length:432 start_codon:yes stop_codon:yes gene_type:complete
MCTVGIYEFAARSCVSCDCQYLGALLPVVNVLHMGVVMMGAQLLVMAVNATSPAVCHIVMAQNGMVAEVLWPVSPTPAPLLDSSETSVLMWTCAIVFMLLFCWWRNGFRFMERNSQKYAITGKMGDGTQIEGSIQRVECLRLA